MSTLQRLALACSASLTLCLTASALQAQTPVLRVSGSTSVEVTGAIIEGMAAFPARSLETLGFRLAGNSAGLTAVIGNDTLRFWTTSPFFRARGRIHQLAANATAIAGVVYLPEQFFIQWLPVTYPERFEYRAGTLAVRGAQAPASAGDAAVVTPQNNAPAGNAGARPQPAPPPRRPAARQRLVVIDPGHGGRDPGKIGPNGLAEKEVTLAIARRLATILRERGYEVHLTRSDDRYVSLPERPRLANRWKGDRTGAVFLSIHANSAPASSARGFETFFLSEARTDDERRVAEMENEAIHFDDDPPAAAEGGLDQILNTLRSDFLMRASHDLAAALQDRFATFHPGPNRGVKRAGFYVLVGAIMPAVLVETAFISNRAEATLLGTQSFQQEVALGIADGVDEFFSRNEHLWAQQR